MDYTISSPPSAYFIEELFENLNSASEPPKNEPCDPTQCPERRDAKLSIEFRDYKTSYSLFSLFLPPSLLGAIVQDTNKYAANSGAEEIPGEWSPTNTNELKSFHWNPTIYGFILVYVA